MCPGDGQFGKVYAAVNMKTGELMALKEVNTQILVFVHQYYRTFVYTDLNISKNIKMNVVI